MTPDLFDALERLAAACEADTFDMQAVRAARLEVDVILDRYEDDPT